jgi:hypothetical protein
MAPADRLAQRMRDAGLKVCGDCVNLKEFMCSGFKTPVPSLRSDPACSKFVPKRK